MTTTTIPSRTLAVEARVDALEALLIEKGILDPAAIDAIVEYYEHDVGPMNGAKVVARAWTDPDYKSRLLDNGTAAIAELGFGGPEGEHMVVVENTPEVHNVVVCTLCSCYPWPVLGLPPNWYKSAPYRSRMVREPASRARRNGLRRARRRRDPGMGLLGRDPISGAPDAARRHPASRRSAARRARHSRFHDRGRAPMNRTPAVADGLAEPSIPRSNGTPVFDAPWQGRALAIAILLVERAGCRWDDFRRHLIDAIEQMPDRPYWDSFAAALDTFTLELDLN